MLVLVWLPGPHASVSLKTTHQSSLQPQLPGLIFWSLEIGNTLATFMETSLGESAS